MQKVVSIFTDGGARGNPGPAAVGFLVKEIDGTLIYKKGLVIGQSTNNVAEYRGVIEALKWLKESLKDFQIEKANFYLDSQLIVKQLNGFYKIKNSNLRNLVITIRQLENEIGCQILYLHIAREKNKEADKLVNFALDAS